MALPLTKSAMEALGKRLVKRSSPVSDDLKSLQELLLSFDEPLAIAVDLVRGRLGYEPTSRIKTTGTILDKLNDTGRKLAASANQSAKIHQYYRGRTTVIHAENE